MRRAGHVQPCRETEWVVPPSLLGRQHVSPSHWDPVLIHWKSQCLPCAAQDKGFHYDLIQFLVFFFFPYYKIPEIQMQSLSVKSIFERLYEYLHWKTTLHSWSLIFACFQAAVPPDQEIHVCTWGVHTSVHSHSFQLGASILGAALAREMLAHTAPLSGLRGEQSTRCISAGCCQKRCCQSSGIWMLFPLSQSEIGSSSRHNQTNIILKIFFLLVASLKTWVFRK